MSKKTAPPSPAIAEPSQDPQDGSEQDYKAKNAFDDIIRAEGHKSDPKMMARVHAVAGRHAKALKSIKSVSDQPQSVADLKKLYNTKYHGAD